MNSPDSVPSDGDLVAQIRDGDETSLADLIDRYADRLFDFVARIVRDRDTATEVVQVTFVKAWDSLQRRDVPTHPKAWLYAIARNEAIDELRRRGRVSPTDFDDELSQFDVVDDRVGSDPERSLRRDDMASLIWSAAASLNPNEYSLLDMQLRQELTTEEISIVLGVSAANTHKKMSRLRQSLEEAIGVELLRAGSGHCDGLDEVVERIGRGPLTPTRRRAVSKHVRSCDVCEEHRRGVVAPAAMFSSLAPVALAAPVRAGMAESVALRRGDGPAGATSHRVTRLFRDRLVGSSRRLPLITLIAVTTLVGVVIVVLATRSDADVRDPDDAASPSHTIGEPSPDRVVTIDWSPVAGATGYSIAWDGRRASLPDTTVDLGGDATGAASAPLDDGEWYFHLRTRGTDGEWTSTLHLGPFVIAGSPEPALVPTASAAATTTTTTTTTTTSPPVSTTPAPTPTSSTTTTIDQFSDLIGVGAYDAVFGPPSGGCGYGGFETTIEIALLADGTANLSQAQHLSEGTWTVDGGVVTLALTLDSAQPETYSLESTDAANSFTGENTFVDSQGCESVFPVQAVRSG